MDRMLVVVFENDKRAYEGREVLLQLDAEGSISVYAYAVLKKNADGTSTMMQGDDSGPIKTAVGASLGGLIGMLGGPVGMALGASAGVMAGGFGDLNDARIGDDFIEDVTRKLTPGKFAVVAEIEEEWTAPVDSRMEVIGGTVYRRALSDVVDTIRDEHIAAMKADLSQLKAEMAEAHAERKTNLREKINQLDSKIQGQLQKAKQRREIAERQTQAKVQFLKSKAETDRRKAS